MPCNSNGCDEHDFKTASIWCAYQYHESREDRKVQTMNKFVESMNKPTASAVQAPQADVPQRQAMPPRTAVKKDQATEAQIWRLQNRHHYTGDVSQLTVSEASALIEDYTQKEMEEFYDQ